MIYLRSTKLKQFKQLYIGVLSGTSMNSIDAALVEFAGNNCKIIEKISCVFNQDLLNSLLTIINTSNKCNLVEIGELDHKLGLAFAKAVKKLLIKAKVKPEEVIAIGCHGQNLWHAPNHKFPFTLQLGDPNIICSLNNIITINDFRRKDVALGGQGAPLAPGFHSAVFRSSKHTRAIINIGGICNITVLSRDPKIEVIGFDLGPGNCLMDEWVQVKFKQLKINYDKHGKLASSGKLIPELLKICLKDPYFKRDYPKSTGREYFNQQWLNQKLLLLKQLLLQQNKNLINKSLKNKNVIKINHKNILTTLLYLTAYIIKENIIMLNNQLLIDQSSPISEIYLCGGGSKNLALLALLKEMIPCPVKLTNDLGIDVDWVEAALFAWLAKQRFDGLPGNHPSVTGARKYGILGGIYLPDKID